jgi:hypothetical protein
MARLPTFQEAGIISADVPRLDFAATKEQARFSQGVAENLDRISQFAFGEAERKRKEENKILGIQLRADLESEVQKELNNLEIQVETGQLSNFEDIQNRVKSLQGMARSLAQIDPEQASGLMRSISNGGNVLLKKSSDILVKAYGSQVDTKTNETISTLRRNMETMYSAETDPELISQYEAGARGIAFSLASQNPSTLPSKMEDFEKARIAARNSSMTNFFVTPEFASRPSDAIAKLRSGDAGKYSAVWAKMDEGQRDLIVQSMLKRQADDLQVIDRDNKLSVERNRAENYVDYDLFYRGTIGGDELLRRMGKRGYIPSREEQRQIMQGDIPGAPDNYFGVLDFKARKGQMGLEEANNLFTAGRISLKQRNELFALIDKTDRPDVARAKEFISNAFVPNPLDPSTRAGNVRRAEVTNQLLSEMEQARIDGKPFDAFGRAQALTSSRLQQEDLKALQEDRNRLRDKLNEFGLSYNEDYTDETLQRAGVSNANKRKTIMRIIKSIKDNQ